MIETIDNSFSMSKPATRRDVEQLLTAISTENFYIKAEEYRKIIGISRTLFCQLKQMGRFTKGTHKATLGSRRILIHKFFNMHSQKIEWLGNEKITPNTRRKNMEKTIDIKQKGALQQRQLQNISQINSLVKAGGKK